MAEPTTAKLGGEATLTEDDRKRYNSKIRTLAILFMVTLLFFTFQGGKLAFFLFIMSVSLCAYLILVVWKNGIRSLKGKRMLNNNVSGSSIVLAGSTNTMKIDVRMDRTWFVPYVILRDRLTRSSGESEVIETSVIPEKNKRGEATYDIRIPKRGNYIYEETECITHDTFGFFEFKTVVNMPFALKVLPPTVFFREWVAFDQMFRGKFNANNLARNLRETTTINGVRDYNVGDPFSRIHWNSTARTGQLRSKEYEKEAMTKVWIVLDRHYDSYNSEDEFEMAVSICASLIEYFRKKDIEYGLFSIGKDTNHMKPHKSSEHHKKMSQHFIDVEADAPFPITEALKDGTMFEKGCFVIVISALRDEQMLGKLGWVQSRRILFGYLWLCEYETYQEDEEWVKRLRNLGYLGYTIHELAELPTLLEARI